MRYRNTRTQAVIETACELRGGDWVKEEVNQPKSEPKATKKTKPKKSGE